VHLCRAVSSQLRHISTIGKNLLSSNMSSTCPRNMVNFGPLAAEICWRVWGTPANFNGFASWQQYCSDVAQRRPTKLCTMFGCVLRCYTIYTFPGALAPLTEFFYFTSKSCILLYCQRYCTAADVRRGTRNYRTYVECATYILHGGHHVGHRSAHILVYVNFSNRFKSSHWVCKLVYLVPE